MQRVNFYFLRKKVLARRRLQREPAVEIIVTIAATRARPREQRRHWRAAILDRGRPVRVAASRSRTRPFSTVIIISSLERPRPPAVRRLRRPHNPMNIKKSPGASNVFEIVSILLKLVFFFEPRSISGLCVSRFRRIYVSYIILQTHRRRGILFNSVHRAITIFAIFAYIIRAPYARHRYSHCSRCDA